MEEKPLEPFANWCVLPFYFYRREDLPWIRKAVESGCQTDAPGSLVAWLSRILPIHAMEIPGQRYDIGDCTSYQVARERYPGIVR
jgi:glucose-1-phosphate thymidylyltransferase